MAKVSFLLPVYNGARFITETLHSLQGQDFSDFDIVIVDDGSTDNTEQVVTKTKIKNIRYLKKQNAGLVSALNFGIQHLDCEYVARIDADDICFPNRLQSQLEFINFTQAVAVSSKAENIDVSGNLLSISAPEYDFHRKDVGFFPAREPYLPHPFLTMRLDVLKDIGGFRDAHLAEDSDLCWRLAEQHRIAIQPTVLGRYRIHQNSISSNSVKSLRIQAFYSQLAGINAQRRQLGDDEIPYSNTMQQARNLASSLENLIVDAVDLTPKETAHLRAASAMKFLDLSNWRQINVSENDISYANKSLRRVRPSEENTAKIREIFNGVKIRQPDLFKKKWYQRT